MRVQFLKTLLDGNVTTRKGVIEEIDDWKARELIALGYAVHIPDIERSEAAPLASIVKEVDNTSDPFAVRRHGSPDGSEKPASSSPAAPAPQKRTYKRRKAGSG